MNIGLLGGAFNPPHNGHFLLANYAFEAFGLEKLLFVPSRAAPHKRITEWWGPETRMLLVRVACFDIEPDELRRSLEALAAGKALRGGAENIPPFMEVYESLYPFCRDDRFSVSDIEVSELKNEKSYTIDTVRRLLERNPGWKIHIIIGMDEAVALDAWKDIGDLSELAVFCAADRDNKSRDLALDKSPFLSFFDFPEIELSSTMIRERLIEGRDISGMVPLTVRFFLDYFFLKP